MWTRLAMRIKLTALVVSIVSASTLTLGQLAIRDLMSLLNRVQGLRAMTAAKVLSATIDGGWTASWTVDKATEIEYTKVVERISGLIKEGQVARVDILRFIDDKNIIHIVTLPVTQTADFFESGTVESVQSEDVYSERAAGYVGVELATPGEFMGGWAPILFQGKPVGLVVVAVDIDDTQRALDTVYVATAATLLALILLTGITAYKLATVFEKSAVTDGLMGIYNHKFFKQRLDQEISKSRRHGQQTALVLLDIDFFKRINDTYGHATGDLVLKSLAKWVLESSRFTDIVARYGGEEIAVILPHTSLAGAQEFSERLRQKVSNQVIRDADACKEFSITISVGVAQWEKGMDASDMIKRADLALYHSKNSGRDRVSIFKEDPFISIIT